MQLTGKQATVLPTHAFETKVATTFTASIAYLSENEVTLSVCSSYIRTTLLHLIPHLILFSRFKHQALHS